MTTSEGSPVPPEPTYTLTPEVVAFVVHSITWQNAAITTLREENRMTHADQSAQNTRVEQGLNSLAAEISTEMAELKAHIDAAAAAGTDAERQAEINRTKASADRVEQLAAQLRSDNPAPPPVPNPPPPPPPAPAA